MSNIWAGNRQTFLVSADRQTSYVSGASVVENEVPKLERLIETVGRLKFGKADMEKANIILAACLTQVNNVLQNTNQNTQKVQPQVSESPEPRPSFR